MNFVSDEFLNRIIPLRGKKPALLELRSSNLFILCAVCWSVFTVSTPSAVSLVTV